MRPIAHPLARPGVLAKASLTALASLVALGVAPSAASASAGIRVTHVREVAHFCFDRQEQPENLTLEPDGSADLALAGAREVVRVHRGGAVTVLAVLPPATNGTVAGISGIVRAPDGTLYINYKAGDLSGIWRIGPNGGPAAPFVPLPGVKFLNGLALDTAHGTLYATDSAGGAVWRISLRDRTARRWAYGPKLEPVPVSAGGAGFGANGVKVHDGAVWVTNSDRGTLLRIPMTADGGAEEPVVRAKELVSVDDFAFPGPGDTVLVAQNYISQVSLVQPDGTHEAVLTRDDGLSNPSSVAVRGSYVYVASAAYFTHTDPNLLLAKLG